MINKFKLIFATLITMLHLYSHSTTYLFQNRNWNKVIYLLINLDTYNVNIIQTFQMQRLNSLSVIK